MKYKTVMKLVKFINFFLGKKWEVGFSSINCLATPTFKTKKDMYKALGKAIVSHKEFNRIHEIKIIPHAIIITRREA